MAKRQYTEKQLKIISGEISIGSINGQYINYTHSSDGEKLVELSASVGVENANTMAYTGDLLQSLSHNNTTIGFEYDEKNAVKDIRINNSEEPILSKTTTYGSGATQTLIQYANGANIKKYYDKYNRLIKVTELTIDSEGTITAETQLCAYLYHNKEVAVEIVDPEDARLSRNSDSQLRTFIDSAAGTRTKYYYDEYGKLKSIWTDSTRELVAEKDAYNRTTTATFIDGEDTIKNHFTYKNIRSNEIESERVEAPEGDTNVYYERDALKRLGSVKVTQNGNGYKRAYNYVPRGAAVSPEGTTNYIESISYYNVLNNVETLEKTENVAYNTDGNIVTYGENTYVYDRIGRLVRENNKALDKTYTFMYNEGGNIVSKNEYVYTEDIIILGTPTETYNYTYGNTWKDQLTSFDGSSIVYDVSGNPTSYLGKTLTWSRGRLLTKYVDSLNTVSMVYDANGIRISKSRVNKYNTFNSTYTYDSQGRLRTETEGTFTRNYLYSADGIIGYEENGERFIYRKNLFGDVTAIYKGTTKVAEYVYDAWGNCTITLNNSGYGSRNPIRYRGYYWDEDLGMYYLMTRYYDPKTSRFINADSFEYLDPERINGLNLYSYCGNNPIMNVDPSGHNPVAILLALIGAALLGSLVYSFLQALEAQRNDFSTEEIDSKASSIIGTVFMIHSNSWALIENAKIGSIFGNITVTTTTQLNDDKLIFGYVDTGENDYSVGSGINTGLIGIDSYISSEFGVGSNTQLFSFITWGMGIGKEGISFGVGTISSPTTTTVNFNVGWGTLVTAGVLVGLSYLTPWVVAAVVATMTTTATVALC